MSQLHETWHTVPIIQPIFSQGLPHYDLELLHHFTTTTALSLLDVYGIESPPVLDIYQRYGPRLALAHLFLMHSLLALSALHLHWLVRKNKPSTSPYFALSCYHRAQMVKTYNSSQCDGVNSSIYGGLSDAQFLTNLILSLHAFCDLLVSLPEHMLPTLPSIYWFINGPKLLDKFYCTEDGHTLVGPTSPASSQGQGPSVYFPNISYAPHSSPTCMALSPLLYSLHTPHAGAPDDTELLYPDPPNTAQIYADAVHALHVGYRLFFERHAPMRVVMIWMASMILGEIAKLLALQRPRAIVVFVHATILHRWCHLREAQWWEIDPEQRTGQVREMLPSDSWKEYLDTSLPCDGLQGY
ncbi:hypothetical protein DL96DRAFT_1823926 [Flagelloscypha sp. PMI_526]|nr:hypothetical protein DL96DRAFT_1823926 [Flagelloscypha sp. PMI_526]